MKKTKNKLELIELAYELLSEREKLMPEIKQAMQLLKDKYDSVIFYNESNLIKLEEMIQLKDLLMVEKNYNSSKFFILIVKYSILELCFELRIRELEEDLHYYSYGKLSMLSNYLSNFGIEHSINAYNLKIIPNTNAIENIKSYNQQYVNYFAIFILANELDKQQIAELFGIYEGKFPDELNKIHNQVYSPYSLIDYPSLSEGLAYTILRNNFSSNKEDFSPLLYDVGAINKFLISDNSEIVKKFAEINLALMKD